MRKVNVGQRIKERRKALKISADDIAKELGVSRSTIFRYEKGDIEKLPTQNLAIIAKVLKTTPEELMGWEANSEDITAIYNQLERKRQNKVYKYAEKQLDEQNNVIYLDVHKKIANVNAKVSAGIGVYNFRDEESFPVEVKTLPEKYDFAFQVQGDSMEPVFEDGEVIFVEEDPEVLNGQIGVVEINDELFVKKMYIENNALRLVSLNKNYKEVIADGTDNICVIGRVIYK